MALIPVKIAMLHSPLFLAGKSFPASLDPTKVSGLKIEYDDKHDKIFVTFNGQRAVMPTTSTAYWIEGEPVRQSIDPYRQAANAPVIRQPVSAQVESPQSHVFDGPGAGKS